MSQFGVGLRHEHFPYLSDSPQTSVDWFEVISENFMNTRGYPFELLMKIREDYEVSLHGVGMNLGGESDVSRTYLEKLKELIDLVRPMIVSDHLCWTGLKENNLHNLLPLSYNDESLNFLANRISKVQDFLGREIAIENLSAYFSLKDSTYHEWDFIRILAKKAGCKILLDINNVYVNSVNQNFNPLTYIDSIPDDLIAEIHLAGFTDTGKFLFDTHSKPAGPEVWELYKHKICSARNVPTLFEWDEDIPEFSVLEKEAMKAKEIWSMGDVKNR